MTDLEYVKRLEILYKKVLSLRSDEDYAINQSQMDKLIKVLTFFMDESKRQDGKLAPTKLVPREEHGGVTCTFLVFDIYGDTVKQFCDVMKECSAITIDGTEDGICISCTVPNIFIKKP